MTDGQTLEQLEKVIWELANLIDCKMSTTLDYRANSLLIKIDI